MADILLMVGTDKLVHALVSSPYALYQECTGIPWSHILESTVIQYIIKTLGSAEVLPFHALYVNDRETEDNKKTYIDWTFSTNILMFKFFLLLSPKLSL